MDLQTAGSLTLQPKPETYICITFLLKNLNFYIRGYTLFYRSGLGFERCPMQFCMAGINDRLRLCYPAKRGAAHGNM